MLAGAISCCQSPVSSPVHWVITAQPSFGQPNAACKNSKARNRVVLPELVALLALTFEVHQVVLCLELGPLCQGE